MENKKSASPEASSKPVKTYRLHGVSVSVFANRNDRGVYHKASVARTYKDGDAFKSTNSLGRDDLPVAAHLMQQAYGFVLDAEAEQPSS